MKQDKLHGRPIVGLGEALWDMLPDGSQLGGAPANFAYHASQFGFPAIAVSALGEDSLGDDTVRAFDEHNLKHLMPRVPYPTGTVQVTLDEQGVPSYHIKEGVAWDNIPFTPEMETIAHEALAVCWGSLAQRNAVSQATIGRFLDATQADCLKIFDINLRQHYYSREVIETSLQRCDILKINDEELAIVGKMMALEGLPAEEQCRSLVNAYGLKMLILTCGTDGSHVFTPEESSFLPTPAVQVADTVGAGDSFTGAFCAAILNGLPVREAHRRAVDVSAFVCTQDGAMPVVPESLKA
ncbi:MAG: carbohydrate kinase [Prevotella sp.]|nr:carbohydrate kinase [Prevotella sp.]